MLELELSPCSGPGCSSAAWRLLSLRSLQACNFPAAGRSFQCVEALAAGPPFPPQEQSSVGDALTLVTALVGGR